MSVGVEMTVKQLHKYLKGLPKALRQSVVKGIRVGANRAIAIAQAAGDNAPPASDNGKRGAFDTGNYRRRWRVINVSDGALLVNTAAYANIIRRGRRPGRRMPPLKVIQKFAERRLGLSKKEAKRAAFPIARAIARRGLRARNVPDSVEPKIVEVVLEEVKRSISQALKSGGGE